MYLRAVALAAGLDALVALAVFAVISALVDLTFALVWARLVLGLLLFLLGLLVTLKRSKC